MNSTTGTTRTTSTPISTIRDHEERGDTMTASVLERSDGKLVEFQATSGAGLGGLHDEAAKVDESLLPCRVNDPELWFAELPADVEFAKALCQSCPVRQLCLGGALERREPWGVWGGELFLQGTVIPRKRPRGRPRKDAAA
jgi:WhiB family transcriptional regulator, redox-sensing transcriptional regulator